MRGWLLAAAVAWLAACTPPPTPGGGNGPGPTGPSTPPHEMTSAQCQAAGGTMRPVCMMGTVQCVVTYSDAGQACRDGDDCQGDCRADDMGQTGAVTGRCQANSDPCGCFANVEDGRIDGALCVD
jgi:hypothetical protein